MGRKNQKLQSQIIKQQDYEKAKLSLLTSFRGYFDLVRSACFESAFKHYQEGNYQETLEILEMKSRVLSNLEGIEMEKDLGMKLNMLQKSLIFSHVKEMNIIMSNLEVALIKCKLKDYNDAESICENMFDLVMNYSKGDPVKCANEDPVKKDILKIFALLCLERAYIYFKQKNYECAEIYSIGCLQMSEKIAMPKAQMIQLFHRRENVQQIWSKALRLLIVSTETSTRKKDSKNWRRYRFKSNILLIKHTIKQAFGQQYFSERGLAKLKKSRR